VEAGSDIHISYRAIDFECYEDCSLLSNWNNDPDIKHLFNRFQDAASFAKEFTPEYFQKTAKNVDTENQPITLMVLNEAVPMGYGVIEIDSPKLLKKDLPTAWLALLIGDHGLRKCGLGALILKHLESLAENSGAKQIEIGVFAYNERALGFFRHHGYVEFTRRPDFVWWKGKHWPEIRLHKRL